MADFTPKEIGEFARKHKEIADKLEPKSLYAEDDCMNHLPQKMKEFCDNDIVLKATLKHLFRIQYEYKYYVNNEAGLTDDDINNTIFQINKLIGKYEEEDA